MVLLQCALHDPVLSAETTKQGSDTHRVKVRLWQGLTAAAAFLASSRQRQAAEAAVKGEVHACMSVSACSPSGGHHVEHHWCIAAAVSEADSLCR